MRVLRLVPILAVAVSSACGVGRKVQQHEVATRPQGIEVKVRAEESGEVTGELLAVQDSSLLVLVPPQRIVELRYESVNHVALRRFRTLRTNGRVPGAEELHRWRSVARFPQGLSDALLAQLLERSGQAAVERLP